MANPRPNPASDPPVADRVAPGERYSLTERRRMQLEVNHAHVDVEELYDSSGLFSIISQRRHGGEFTFAVFKSFERNGTERTSFIPESLGENYVRIVQRTLERIAKIRSDGTAPFPERGR